MGTLRREPLDHVIVLNEGHLRRRLRAFIGEYHRRSRTHLSLDEDAPDPRSVEPPELGAVIELPRVGELPHRYTRRAASASTGLLLPGERPMRRRMYAPTPSQASDPRAESAGVWRGSRVPSQLSIGGHDAFRRDTDLRAPLYVTG